MSRLRIVVVGGGAAGVFAAIAAAEEDPTAEVTVLEKSRSLLSKVRVSGGGRCNVTHACFDAREFTRHYPRGGKALIGPFHRFQASDTVEWFESRGVALKTESDGRMFPVTDRSQTVIDGLMNACRKARVALKADTAVDGVEARSDGTFALTLKDGRTVVCDRLLLATGGARSAGRPNLFEALGHSGEPPVPSLFTFHIEVPWLRELAGVSVPDVGVAVTETGLKERGPLLITHRGVSGPAILKLSAWGARAIRERRYDFGLRVDWRPDASDRELEDEIDRRRSDQPAGVIRKLPLRPIPMRLWERIAASAGIEPATRWSGLSRVQGQALIQQLKRAEFRVSGKSMNKEEFVTCGGVRLDEVDFRTMESRIVPHLYFAGEVLDIDGLTGGFNFQAAWTTGWIAGRSMASARARHAG